MIYHYLFDLKDERIGRVDYVICVRYLRSSKIFACQQAKMKDVVAFAALINLFSFGRVRRKSDVSYLTFYENGA